MEQTWRWFGPDDAISLTKIRQAGATGVVTALHSVAPGDPWTHEAVTERRALIEASGLRWSVVESLPVHGDVRLRRPGFERYIDNYVASLESLGRAGVTSVCYNFMPVIDWTRTTLDWITPDGSSTLRFDQTRWAVFDVFLLQRPGANDDYSAAQLEAAERLFHRMSAEQRQTLARNVAIGLPGANETGHDLASLREALGEWTSIDGESLRARLVEFLKAVLPTCEHYGIRLCLHPDDPPRPLLGLPRIASCEADFVQLFTALPSACNAMTLCVGSLGASRDNDPMTIAQHLIARVGFAHLRSVRVEDDGSFVETDHLDGDTDLVQIIRLLVAEERRRRAADEPFAVIPMRPDHGRVLEGDIAERPGYPWLGRLKALAELRGILRAVERLT